MRSRLIATALLLVPTACHQPDTPATSSAMDLLHSGSPRVCTASEVQQTLHDMIMPKMGDIDGDGTAADKKDALSAVTLAYRETTLQSFDQTVNRATCNATLEIAENDKSDDFEINYQISPSADDPRLFVIAANLIDAKAYVKGAVADTAAQAAHARQAQVDAAQEQQAHAQLIARLNPRWLVGRWIGAGGDPTLCASDHGLTLASDHTFSTQGNTGRWSLDADQIHLIGGGGPLGPVNEILTVTQADQESFASTSGDGQSLSWRRCARGEMGPPPSSPTAPGNDTAGAPPLG